MTNSLSFLPQVDSIVMVDNGEIQEAGKYDELKAKNGPFAEFIKNYQTSKFLRIFILYIVNSFKYWF